MFFVITIMLFAILAVNTYADQYDDVTNELEGLKTFNDLNSANRTNEATLNDLNKQLQSIKGKILFENEIEKTGPGGGRKKYSNIKKPFKCAG